MKKENDRTLSSLELPTADEWRRSLENGQNRSTQPAPSSRARRHQPSAAKHALIARACWRPLGLFAVILCLIACPGRQASGASLESQWRNLPEVTVKPESGAGGKATPLSGGNSWQQSAQAPDSVPVEFYIYFKSSVSKVTATLGGQSVEAEDPYGSWQPENIFIQSDPATASLKPNQTYTLTLSGSQVYSAEVHLSAPGLNAIFQTATIGKQPARLYNVYFFNPEHQKWEKTCPSNFPRTPQLDLWQDVNLTFQVQVRPDLGARPVTRPGQRAAGPEDQGDDAWTREEPATDARTAAGDGDPVTIGSSKQGDPASARFNWAVSMGRLWSGAGAGRITLDEWRLGTNAFTPLMLNYVPRSDDTNEVAVVMDLDNTNCLSQIKAPQALANIDPLYGPALLTNSDLIDMSSLRQKLTNHNDLVSDFLWTHFSTNAQQVLTNINSTVEQIQSTLLGELNPILQGGCIYSNVNFEVVTLSGRTKRLLLRSLQDGLQGEALVRLNRFLLEDAYPLEIARLRSTSFDIAFYTPAMVGPLDDLGFFTLQPSASSFATWRIGLPDGATNQWRLQEIRNATTNTTLLAYGPGAGLWTLTRGTGSDARAETRTIVTNSVSGTNFCTETQEVKNGTGTLSDRTTEVYQQFDWGYELVAVTNDPGGANLVTTFTFNGNTNDLAAGKKIVSIIYPDGFWERRTYSPGYDYYLEYYSWLAWPQGALVRVVQPWKDSPSTAADNDSLVTDYVYNADRPGNYTLQKWHDAAGAPWPEPTDPDPYLDQRIVSPVYQEKTWYDTDPCSDTPGIQQETRQLGNIEHYGEYHNTKTFPPYYGRLSGQLYSKENNVAKLDSYDYEFGVWDSGTFVFTPSPTNTNDVRQTIFHGGSFSYAPSYDQLSQGPSGAPIEPVSMEPNRSTKEVRIIHGGNLVAKEAYVYQGDYTSFALVNQVIYHRDALGHATNVVRIDPSTHQPLVIYQADWTGGGTWPADLKLSETDEAGTVYNYTYYSLKRVHTKVKQAVTGQSAIATTLSYDAANRVLTNKLSAGSLSQTTTTHFDLAGRKTEETDTAGLTTTCAYQNDGRQITATASSGAATIINKFLDRRLASITGSAVTNQFFDYKLSDYSVFPAEQPKNIAIVTLGSSNSLRCTAQTTDPRYEQAQELKPAFGLPYTVPATTFMDASGLWRREMLWDLSTWGGFFESGLDVVRGHSLQTLWLHDPLLERTAEVRPGQAPGYTDFLSGLCRITTWTNFFQQDGSSWFYVTEEWTYPNYGTYDDNGAPVLVARAKERLTGFTSTGVSETQSFDADTNQTTVSVTVNLASKTLTLTTNVAQSSLTAAQVVVNGLVQSASSTTVAQPTLFYYDALGRQTGVKDSLGNLNSTQYNPITGQVTATINPFGQATSFEYYPAGQTNAGLLKCQTGPTGRKTCYNYDGCERVIQTWGDVPYPEQRQYSQFGDLITLTTYRSGSSWGGSSWPPSPGTGDVTHWYYDEPTGLLTNKTDAAGQPVMFDYYANWLPKSRIWARGVASTNIYDFDAINEDGRRNDDLIRIDYSDSTSVALTNADFPYLNRRGKPDVVVDSAGTSLLTYDHAERLVSTRYTDGLLAGITVTNHFNPVCGRDALMALGPSWATTNTYGYDGYGRMGAVANGIYAATYGYWPNSDLLQTTTCKSNITTALTTTRAWETGPRLRSIANTAGGAVVSSHSYLYDWLDRRIQATLEDGSLWKYNYNNRNELIGAHRFWSDWSPVAGQQYGYDYDNIGNRLDAVAGGDTNGRNLRTTFYGANNLNEYTNITNPGYASIIGAALATNGVTVNDGAADRKGEYFHGEISVANGSGPLWQTVAVSSGGCTTNGGCALPANTQRLAYDADGNLTSDGTWTYQWDCENRLAAMTMTNIAGLANSNRLRLEFVYDYLGRRTAKTVKSWNGSAFGNPVTTLFVYDGWNLLAELSCPNAVLRTCMWGLDLSGTMYQAGGIGGLLMLTTHASPNTNCFVSYDGNGNILGLVNAADRGAEARYEYSPYGELLHATGPLARSNPFRWSTKFWDDESGLVYYGYRYYSPSLGRWISKDPMEEEGGLHLYAFVLNSPVFGLDARGQFLLLDLLASTTLRMAKGSAWGALYGAVIKGAFSSVSKIMGAQKSWTDVGIDILKGAGIGALTGATGSLMKGAGSKLFPTGFNGSLPGPVAGIIGGMNAGIGFLANAAMSDKGMAETMSSNEGKLGAAIVIFAGGFFGVHGNTLQDLDGGVALDSYLRIAGSLGGGAANTVMNFVSAFENAFDR